MVIKKKEEQKIAPQGIKSKLMASVIGKKVEKQLSEPVKQPDKPSVGKTAGVPEERLVRFIRETNDYHIVESFDQSKGGTFFTVSNKRNGNKHEFKDMFAVNKFIMQNGLR